MNAFFLPTSDPSVFEATRRTEGLWTAGIQHAGPPSALLVRAIERLPSSLASRCQVSRICVEILGPIPTGPVTVNAAVARPGRGVELVEAELTAGGRVAMRARAWRIRTTSLTFPSHALTALPALPERPEVVTEFTNPAWTEVYLGAVEWRFVRGQFDQPGPAQVWARLRIPLVASEEPTPLQCLIAVADSGNGLSGQLEFDDWWYINTDLTVHLHRAPVGEWVFVDARSILDPSGVGLAMTDLGDVNGPVGRGAQSLLVGPRS